MRAWVFALCVAAMPLRAEIQYVVGPAKADIGGIAEIHVPEGWRFVPKESMEAFNQAFNNTNSSIQMGCLAGPENQDDSFWAFFEWDETGKVGGNEYLDPTALWESMLEKQRDDNVARKEKGLATMELVRWEMEPSYDPPTQRLQWVTRIRAHDKELIKFNAKFLGRHGVMQVVVVTPGELYDVLPKINDKIATFAFKPGMTYGDWSSGDKVSAMGLSALVVGGATSLKTKNSILSKPWLWVMAGVMAAFAAKKIFFGKANDLSENTEDTPVSSPSTAPSSEEAHKSVALPSLDDDPNI